MIGDALNVILRELASIPSAPIGVLMVSFFIGYLTGGIFTADTWAGRIGRGFVAFVLASAGIYDAIIALKGSALLFFLLGFAFNVRAYITAFFEWMSDLVVGLFRVVSTIWNGVIEAGTSFMRGMAKMMGGMKPSGTSRPNRPRDPEPSKPQNSPDIEAERRRREEDAHRFRRAQEEARAHQEREDAEKREQQKPPHQDEEEDATRSVDAAIRYFGLDKHLFRYEDLRKAHRVRVLALHPDKLQSMPEYIRRQIEEEIKRANVARDLLKKWKGWI